MTVSVFESGEWSALVAAVRASPADDLPRLVATDFAEEGGEAEYAEFVRVQCELDGFNGLRKTFHRGSREIRRGRDWHAIQTGADGLKTIGVNESRQTLNRGDLCRFEHESGGQMWEVVAERALKRSVDREVLYMPDEPSPFLPTEPQSWFYDLKLFDVARLDALEQAERRLRNEYGTRWIADRPCLSHAAESGGMFSGPDGAPYWILKSYPYEIAAARFRRGFVDTLACTLEGWVLNADGFLRYNPISKVTIGSSGLENFQELVEYESPSDRFSLVKFFGKGDYRNKFYVNLERPLGDFKGRIKLLLELTWPGIEFELSSTDTDGYPRQRRDAAGRYVPSGVR